MKNSELERLINEEFENEYWLHGNRILFTARSSDRSSWPLPTKEDLLRIINLLSQAKSEYDAMSECLVFPNVTSDPDMFELLFLKAFCRVPDQDPDACLRQKAFLSEAIPHLWTLRDFSKKAENLLYEAHEIIFSGNMWPYDIWKVFSCFLEYSRWDDHPISFGVDALSAKACYLETYAHLSDILEGMEAPALERLCHPGFGSEEEYLLWRLSRRGTYRKSLLRYDLTRLKKDIRRLRSLGIETGSPKIFLAEWHGKDQESIIMLREISPDPDESIDERCERIMYCNIAYVEVGRLKNGLSGRSRCQPIPLGSFACRLNRHSPFEYPCFGYTLYSLSR